MLAEYATIFLGRDKSHTSIFLMRTNGIDYSCRQIIGRGGLERVATQLYSYSTSLSLILSTYDHGQEKIGLPVRSAVLKLLTGQLVLQWVTMRESWLLYVFL